MSYEREQKVNEQHSQRESSSDSETPPPPYHAPACVADKANGDSLVAKIYYYLSVESDQEDDEDDVMPSHPSSDASPEPFDEQDGNAEDNVEEVEQVEEDIDIDDKISKIEGLENLVLNSPSWYLHIKPHLTQDELKELWDRTPWAIKWFWDDNVADDEDEYGNQERGRYIIQVPFF